MKELEIILSMIPNEGHAHMVPPNPISPENIIDFAMQGFALEPFGGKWKIIQWLFIKMCCEEMEWRKIKETLEDLQRCLKESWE